jgi:glycosyltransferase involved in cell wall biosynthesis
LIKALSLVKNKDIQLLVAGEFYDDKREYEKLIRTLNLEDRVRLVDNFIPEHEIKVYFSAADLLVQPYRSATQSGVAQIAYHFGLPMVVTDVGGLPEIVENNTTGFIAEVDEASVAEKIEKYFNETDQAEMRKAVDEKAKFFSWDNFAEDFLFFIQNT